MYTSDNSIYSLTQHENSVPSMLSYRAFTVYIYIYVIGLQVGIHLDPDVPDGADYASTTCIQ